MNNKGLIGAFLAVAIGCSSAIATADESSPYWQRKQQIEDARRPQPSQMTMQEKQFAMRLSDLHRQIFVYQFTPAQRQEAMAFVTTNENRGWRSSKVTPDMAIEEVIKNHRGIHTGQGSGSMEADDESESRIYSPRTPPNQNRVSPYSNRQNGTKQYQRSAPQGSYYGGEAGTENEESMYPPPQNEQNQRNQNWQTKPRYYQSQPRSTQQPRETYENRQNRQSEQNYYKRQSESPYNRQRRQQNKQTQKQNGSYSYFGSPSSSDSSEKKMQRSKKNRSQGYWYNTDSSTPNQKSQKNNTRSNRQTQRGYWD